MAQAPGQQPWTSDASPSSLIPPCGRKRLAFIVNARSSASSRFSIFSLTSSSVCLAPASISTSISTTDCAITCPRIAGPAQFWAIDTHLDFDRCREKAPRFDLVFAAQRDGVDLLRGIGVQSASWLPLACDPGVHRKHDDVAKQYDVAFVGNVFPGPRAELLGIIQRRYRNSFVGQRYFDEMARTYSAARIVFNRSIRNDVNMRVFEAVACGSLLTTNDLSENGLGELLRDGVQLATYRDGDDLVDKLAFYLEREALRERIAAAGLAEVIAKHTYAHRMETILRRAEEALSNRTVAVGHHGFGAGLPTTPSVGLRAWADERCESPTKLAASDSAIPEARRSCDGGRWDGPPLALGC